MEEMATMNTIMEMDTAIKETMPIGTNTNTRGTTMAKDATKLAGFVAAMGKGERKKNAAFFVETLVSFKIGVCSYVNPG